MHSLFTAVTSVVQIGVLHSVQLIEGLDISEPGMLVLLGTVLLESDPSASASSLSRILLQPDSFPPLDDIENKHIQLAALIDGPVCRLSQCVNWNRLFERSSWRQDVCRKSNRPRTFGEARS